MESAAALFIGCSLGLAGGLGLFLLRRFVWDVARLLGFVGAAVLVIAVIGGVVAIGSAFSKGGDGAMAGMVFLIFGVGGLAGSAFLSALLALLQARPTGRRPLELYLSCLLDPMLAGVTFWMFQAQVIAPMTSERVNDWWKLEQERRSRIQQLEASIPPQYRNMPIQMIDDQNRMRHQMRERGIQVPPVVPQDVELKIRNLANARATPVGGSPIDYQGVAATRKGGMGGLALGWLLGSFVLPLLWGNLFPTKPKPEPN